MTPLILALPPHLLPDTLPPSLTVAHMAYRMDARPRLLGRSLPSRISGGMLYVDAPQWEGEGDPIPCGCQLLTECRRRGFTGLVCDLPREPVGAMADLAKLLDRNCHAQGWKLYLPPAYAPYAPHAHLVLSSWITGGSLERRLRGCLEKYAPAPCVLGIEWMREDIHLPARGRGTPITQAHLEGQMRRIHPSVFFDRGMCAHYYTYLAQGGQAHFVLFDSPKSIGAKLALAKRLSLSGILLPGPDVLPYLPQILG